MAVNKVNYGDTTLIDLTSDTVTADTLLSGQTALAADGTAIVGTLLEGFPESLEIDGYTYKLGGS